MSSTLKEPSLQLLQMAKVWNVLRIMVKTEKSKIGYDILDAICENCLENREEACNECKDLHKQLDCIEKEMPRDLFCEEFKFVRTKSFVSSMRARNAELEAQRLEKERFQNKIQHKEQCQCGRNI